MSEDVIRVHAAKKPGDAGNPFQAAQEVREAVAAETGQPANPVHMTGNIPEALLRAMQGTSAATPGVPNIPGVPNKFGSDELSNLLTRIADKHTWEEVELPSRSRFYDNIPAVLHVRAMTGAEEEILATQRYVRKGSAIDKIFSNCIRENINTQDLLSIDRTYLLIYLRGISYTHEYDVSIRCPSCSLTFDHVIMLNQDVMITDCPDEFGPQDLQGVLPTTGFRYKYRLATGRDDQAITRHREAKIQHAATQDDDTLLYRTALLLESIESVTETQELLFLLKRLPINDVAHLRNAINEPPFGVDTQIGMICQGCSSEFKTPLPMDEYFFFPRSKAKTQA